jgi:hypothetical protein
MRRLVLATVLQLLGEGTYAQHIERAVPFYVRFILPSVVTDSYDLRHWLVQNDLSDSTEARENMDDIYMNAVQLTHGDVTNALLVATVGTMEHESIPLHIAGGTLHIPLTTESPADFEERTAHLPQHVYSVPEDDRDKLQHLFASAWVKRATGMTWLAALAGYLVEAGENAFLIEGAEDRRDLHADRDGIRFGASADPTGSFLPSDAITPNP